MKDVSQLIIDARAAGKPRIDLFQFHFAQGVLNITDAPFNVTVVGGETYLGNGLILKVGGIQSKTELVNLKKTIDLSGSDLSIISTILSASQVNRQVLQYQAYLNDDYSIIDVPYLEWQGIITNIDSDGSIQSPKVKINTSSIFDDFDRRVNRTTSIASQQSHFPLDMGMKYAAEVNEQVKWGFK
jgi:hypothetical protein